MRTVKLLMGEVAYGMTDLSGAASELLETVQETEVRRLAHRIFHAAVPSELYTVSSLLEPIGPRWGSGITLRFFHRSFQEYFLATELVRRRQPAEGFPPSVKAFADDIAQAP